MKNSRIKNLALLVLPLILLSACGKSYDIVITGGTVIDPETKINAQRNLAISDGQIVAITEEMLKGSTEIDASGLIVAPGFIDIHSHSPTKLGADIQVLDGVTTQLDLEAGAFPQSEYGYLFADGARLNFGASVSHLAIRIKVIEDKHQPYVFTKDGVLEPAATFVQVANDAEIEEMRLLLNEGIDEGGLGIGVALDYISSAVSSDELRMIFEVAGNRKTPVYVHVRRGMPGDPTGLDEVINLAEQTGAPLLICHIVHSAMQRVTDWTDKIDAANARGANITTETLSYAAGGAAIMSDVFTRDWRAIFNINYSDVQWTGTGEWLTKESFERYQKEEPQGFVNHHYVKEEWLEDALKWPRMMVSSDVTPAFDRKVLANPNGAGTFSRLLGYYVREKEILTLEDALARISLYPAQWLEQTAPVFLKKGRLCISCDADIVMFDPETISANAIYGDPYLKPIGMVHVLVGGKHVVKNGTLVEDRYPGRRVLGRKTTPKSQ